MKVRFVSSTGKLNPFHALFRTKEQREVDPIVVHLLIFTLKKTIVIVSTPNLRIIYEHIIYYKKNSLNSFLVL